MDVLCTFARNSGSSAVDETLAAGAAVLARADRSTLEGRRRAMVEALRQAAVAHIEAVAKSQTWPPWVGVWALSMAGSGPDDAASPLEQALVAGYEQVTARYEEQYGAMFRFCGFRVKAPLTLHELTVAAGALAEGLVLRERVDNGLGTVERPTGPGDRPQPWTIFALGLVALVEQFVEPDPDWEADGH